MELTIVAPVTCWDANYFNSLSSLSTLFNTRINNFTNFTSQVYYFTLLPLKMQINCLVFSKRKTIYLLEKRYIEKVNYARRDG